jgi:parvulin-like peptidyl-prolyl isomerase
MRLKGIRPIQGFGLLALGALLVVLFVIFAVTQGIGSPSVPAGDAAIVKGGPSGKNTIGEAEVRRAIGRQIAAAGKEGKEKAPRPGSKKYEELKETAFGELIQLIWIKGEAEEMNISATAKQIEEKLEEIKKQSFPTPKAYKEFLKTSDFTQADVNARVEEQVLGSKIEERVKGEAEPAGAGEIQAYYDKEKAAQFTVRASRDVRVIINKDKSKVEAARKALEGDRSPASWKKAAARYSSDPATKSIGGLQKEVTEEFVKGELKKAIFDKPTGELSGPIRFQQNYLLIEPVKINAEKVKPLAEVRSQISQTIGQKKQEDFFSEFATAYQAKWSSRTFCASGFEVEQCANYPASKTLEKSREPYKACYEADPKTPTKECPAPVPQAKPALPGTVTPDSPNGEQLPQRPHPPGGDEEGETNSELQTIR